MKKTRRKRRIFNPQEKITAVLSIWTESRTATQMCREMGVSWALLDRWQNQAMEGMLAALSPKKKQRNAELNTRLLKLVEKKVNSQSGKLGKLGQRLEAIQKGKQATA